MPRKAFRLMLGATSLAVLSVSLSGCFVWQSFHWDPSNVKAGKKTTAVITEVPVITSNPPPDKDTPAVLIGFSENTVLSLGKKRTFDTKGKFGGPYSMFKDGALANAALDSDTCHWGANQLNTIQDVVWTAVRTDPKVNDHNKQTPATVKIAIKADASAATPNQDAVYLIAGGWNDDGDDIPETDEVACFGGTYTILGIK